MKKNQSRQPLLIVIGIVSFSFVCFLLVWLVFTESAKYEAPSETDTQTTYTPEPAQSSLFERISQKMQHVESQESQFQEQGVKDYNRTSQELENQLQDLKLKKDLFNNQRSPFK